MPRVGHIPYNIRVERNTNLSKDGARAKGSGSPCCVYYYDYYYDYYIHMYMYTVYIYMWVELHLIHLQTMPAASPAVRTARSMLMSAYTFEVFSSLERVFFFFDFFFAFGSDCLYYVVFDQPHRLKAVFYLMINLPHGAPLFHYPFSSVLFFSRLVGRLFFFS